MRTVPATPRLSPSVPFLLRHRARRRGPCHPQLLCYQRRCRFLVVRVTDTVSGRRTTPAVISPCSGTALTRLISRSTPYLTFLQHQHLLSVSVHGRSRPPAPPSMARSRPPAPPPMADRALSPAPGRPATLRCLIVRIQTQLVGRNPHDAPRHAPPRRSSTNASHPQTQPLK